jgi:VanZ family protein
VDRGAAFPDAPDEPDEPDAPGRVARGLRAAGRGLLRVPLPLSLGFAAAWAAMIWRFSSHSTPVSTKEHLGWEFLSNLAHAPLFGILALLLGAALLRDGGGGWPRPTALRYALVAAATAGYGVIDELHQSRVPGRNASVFDVVTDLVAALIVLWIVAALGRADLSERGLLRRLGLGVLACLAAAGAASLA